MSEVILKEDWINPKIETRQVIDKGIGMFAIRPIKKGEKVLIWGGEYINKEQAEKAKSKGKLVIQWDDNLFSTEDAGNDRGYFINHSCDPNAWMSDTFTIVAMKDINIGDEITIDYAIFEDNENYISKWECKCGSPICRKKITGRDWELEKLQKKYKNHFSPLINKKIYKSK